MEGANGSGKTTFLKMIFNNFKIEKKKFFNFKTGYINGRVIIYLDDLKINYTLSEEELLQIVLKNNNIKLPEEYVPIHPKKQLFYYSTGELKMVKLRLVFLINPEILLLDEPFDNLDDENKKIILEKINNRSEDKITIITTHIKDVKPLFKKKIIIRNFSLEEVNE